MNDVVFHAKAFREYMEWQAEDRKPLKNKRPYKRYSAQRINAGYRQTGTIKAPKSIQPPH
jgi:hypothetical protein